MTEQETLFVTPLAVMLEDTLPMYARWWAIRRSGEYFHGWLDSLEIMETTGGVRTSSLARAHLVTYGPSVTLSLVANAATNMAVALRDWLDHIATADPPLAKRVADNTARMTLAQAVDKANSWHAALRKRQRENAVEPPNASEDYLTLDDGYRWVRILTPEGLDFEGQAMGHCVGQGGYDGAEVYSLRDARNRPHVTVHVGPVSTVYGVLSACKRVIRQVSGRFNQPVPDELRFHGQAFVRKCGAAGRGHQFAFGMTYVDSCGWVDLENPEDRSRVVALRDSSPEGRQAVDRALSLHEWDRLDFHRMEVEDAA